ncbi:ATP-grasp domain-containing protein [Streptomyces sp. NPDC001165]|uniref:ATP-grasp domain-containing protein n=1 Tax=Streptomyces sp. NPDC001165 TaxID=3364546 RepID=UPI0036784A0A
MNNEQSERAPAVIVDPFTSGDEWAPAFAQRDVPAVAVISSEGARAAYSARGLRPDDFIEVHAWSPGLVERIRTLRPLCVLPGAESGVEIADRLSAELTPSLANDPALAGARRDKGLMQEAVAAAGLPVMRTLATDDAARVREWLRATGMEDRPLILKPPASAGTDGVTLVPAGADWRPAFDALLGRVNRLGDVNRTVVVQEYVTGTEFVVDTVSYAGRHTLCGIARYTKHTGDGVVARYDSVEFVPYDGVKHSSLVSYAYGVLDALGIRFGAGHIEIIMTANGPRLVECGARVHGGGQPELARLGSGSSQVDRLADAFCTDGQEMAGQYEQARTVLSVFLSAPAAGALENTAALARAATLSSHYCTNVNHADGDIVARTTDLFSTLGMIVLAHDRRSQVMSDYAAVRELERQVRVRTVAAPQGASRD